MIHYENVANSAVCFTLSRKERAHDIDSVFKRGQNETKRQIIFNKIL